MNGWVDGITRRWRDPGGKESALVQSQHGQMACPECWAMGRHEVLFAVPTDSAWHCSQHHQFQAALIPAQPVSTVSDDY
jgi:hypothetical protein